MSRRRAGAGALRACCARPLSPVVAVLVLATSACGNGKAVPGALADGSPAHRSDLRFEGVDGPVLVTESRRLGVAAARAAPRVASCLRASWSTAPASPFVHRVGASGESVTFAGGSSRTLQACDGAGSAGTAAAWCGQAFGRLSGGRLRDPRLDLGGCRTSDGDPIAFVWIDPGPGARYVVVRRAGFSEAYETRAGLPVRVATTENVDLARSSAIVLTSEHAADGRRLRTREVKALVSG